MVLHSGKRQAETVERLLVHTGKGISALVNAVAESGGWDMSTKPAFSIMLTTVPNGV